MAKWTNPNEKENAKAGEHKIFLNQKFEITLTSLRSDMTTNMYGDMTDTFDTKFSILQSNNERNPIWETTIHGQLEEISIIKTIKSFYILLNTKKRQYRRLDSNATYLVYYSFIIDLYNHKIWRRIRHEKQMIRTDSFNEKFQLTTQLYSKKIDWVRHILFSKTFVFPFLKKEYKVDILKAETVLNI